MKKETRNAFFGGLLVTAASGLLKPVGNKIMTMISDKTMFTIDITDGEYNLTMGLKQYFTNVPDKVFIEFSAEYEAGMRITYVKNLGIYSRSVVNCSDTIFWNGFPITLKIDAESSKGDNAVNRIVLSTLNIKSARKNLKKFVREMAKIHVDNMIKKTRNETIVWYAGLRGPGLTEYTLEDFKRRTFENVFIPLQCELMIKKSIDNFIQKRDWYLKNNIPYHFGILIYSEPGTGKSSVAQAIADYASAQLISFPGDKINELPKYMNTRITRDTISADSYRVILIEDIDCGFAEKSIEEEYDEHTEEFKTVERKIGLSSILNTLDGLSAPSNVIYIFTTNHIEKLDPALIRPGRCDLKIHIPGITAETFNRFIKYHFGVDYNLPENKLIRNDLTFAELQTDVMTGMSVEELVKKVTNNIS